MNKPISHQRKWQLLMKSQGRCQRCGYELSKERKGKVLCFICGQRNRTEVEARKKMLHRDGRCGSCGRKYYTKKCLCSECLVKAREASRRWRARQKEKIA